MSNVIRPTFGSRHEVSLKEADPSVPPKAEYQHLHIYGIGAGHLVALLRDDAAPEGPVVKVVVGPESGDTVETVAILPATPEGEADADMAAMAVLRALEVIGGGGSARG